MSESLVPSSATAQDRVPDPDELVIRAAVADDESALAALDRRAWSPTHSVQPRPQPPYAAFFTDRNLPEHILVAELDGQPVGYLRLVPAIPLASNAHVRQIQGLAVDERARGRGVARALLAAAYERARRAGATRITLRVLGPNTPARRLYASEGFVEEGVLPGEFLIEGAYVDDVLMGRRLTP
ncbi:GNAT family N-acetyltransferase [Streptomyces sp. NPDC048636]|uniref:GNAT family N-acetyltransferase n=1 Tax=Streptomyces sp. NPDC048636 TaxID=3155762 RepID=UPI00344341AA